MHGAVSSAVEGRGKTRVGEQRFAIEPHVVVVPGWTSCTLHTIDHWGLFAYSRHVAQEKLGFFREPRR